MYYVTDTHSLVWYFTKDQRLSKKAFKTFEETVREGSIIVPAVVLAEIIYISKKGRIILSFIDTLKKIEEYDNFEIKSLDIDILKIVDAIKFDMEMHDKIIVATAIYFKAGLITRDKKIKQSGLISTIY